MSSGITPTLRVAWSSGLEADRTKVQIRTQGSNTVRNRAATVARVEGSGEVKTRIRCGTGP
jgi:hypothetical protein